MENVHVWDIYSINSEPNVGNESIREIKVQKRFKAKTIKEEIRF